MNTRHFAVAALTALGIGCGSPTVPEYKVGDVMPYLSEHRKLYMELWVNKSMTNYGATVFFGINGEVTHAAYYKVCRGELEVKPFAVTDKKAKKLLLDNKPTDGTIDDAFDYDGSVFRQIRDDAPECVTKINI